MMPPSRHFPSGHAGHFGSPIYLKVASASLVQACGLSLLLRSQVRARVATATEAAAIHYSEAIPKILECLGIPSRAPAIARASPDLDIDEQVVF